MADTAHGLARRARTWNEFRQLARGTGLSQTELGRLWRERSQLSGTPAEVARPTAADAQSMADMPSEMLREFAVRAEPRSLLRLCRVSRQFADICADPAFWQARYEREFGLPPVRPYGIRDYDPRAASWKDGHIKWREAYLIRALRIFTIRERVQKAASDILGTAAEVYRWRKHDNPYLEEAMTDYIYHRIFLKYLPFVEEIAPGIISYRRGVTKFRRGGAVFKNAVDHIMRDFIWGDIDIDDYVELAYLQDNISAAILPGPIFDPEDVDEDEDDDDTFEVTYTTGETLVFDDLIPDIPNPHVQG